MVVREYDRHTDFGGVRARLVELQEFERQIDSRRPTGEEIADIYISDALSKCAEHHGRIFIAEDEGDVAGYVTVLANRPLTNRSTRSDARYSSHPRVRSAFAREIIKIGATETGR